MSARRKRLAGSTWHRPSIHDPLAPHVPAPGRLGLHGWLFVAAGIGITLALSVLARWGL